jgi:tetratricopeptide (TPR) repeat protein
MSKNPGRPTVFISYSHKDEVWKDRILGQFGVLESEGLLSTWDDRRITGGDEWFEEIRAALGKAQSAILLISPDFLRSQFILNDELPRLLDRKAREGLLVVPVVVRPCPWKEVEWLNRLQLRPKEGRPLSGMTKHRREVELAALASEILGRLREEKHRDEAPARPASAPTSLDYALVTLGARSLLFHREPLTGETIRRIREGPLPTVVLFGLAGIGKTTLLCEVARRLAEDFPRSLALVFDGPAALEPGYVLEAVNGFLAAMGRGLDLGRLEDRDPRKVFDALAAQLSDQKVLVILDAVDSVPADWLGHVLRRLESAPGVRVLATARSRFDASARTQVLAVLPLSDPEARDFVALHARAYGLDLDADKLVARLPPAIRSHPQCLTILLANLRDLPIDLLLADGMPDEASEPVRVLEQLLRSLSVGERAALALAWVLTELDLAAALRVLQLPSPVGFLASLKALTARSLVQFRGETCSVPALVGEALGSVEPSSVDSAADLVSIAWVRAIGHAGQPQGGLGIVPDIGVRLAIHLRNRGRWGAIAKLAEEANLERLNLHGRWKEYAILLRLGIEAAGRTGDRAAGTSLGFRLMRKALQMGDSQASRSALADVEATLGPVVESADLAELHSHRALLRMLDRDGPGALGELEESRRLRQASGDRSGLAVVDKLTGNIHIRLRQFGEARAALESAIAGFADDPESKHLLDAEISLALCDLEDSVLERAQARLGSAVVRCRALQYDAGLARATLNLALVVERLGRVEEALRLAENAAERALATDPNVAAAAKMLASRLRGRLSNATGG